MPKRHIPEFATDEEAAEFWDAHDFTDYEDRMEPAPDATFGRIGMEQVCLRLLPDQIERLK